MLAACREITWNVKGMEEAQNEGDKPEEAGDS